MSSIPLNIQLEAVCLMACRSEAKKLHDLLTPFIAALPKMEDFSLSTYQALLKQHFHFDAEDLLAYLHEHPEVCRTLLVDSSDKRYADTTSIVCMPNGHYAVGWFDRPVSSQIRAFPTLVEAAADYVLFSCNLSRLTQEQAGWYEVESFE